MSKKILLLSCSILLPLIAQLFVASPARAECTAPDGTVVQTGETYGPYTCLPDGSWSQG